MFKTLTFLLWLGRAAVEACEIVTRSRRALDGLMSPDPWRRPPWGGGGNGGGNFWQGR